jgi:hypothetical protein
VTIEVPTAKRDPLGGVHVTEIGAVPPAAVAKGNVTTASPPLIEGTVCGAGHESSNPDETMDGPVGPPQPAAVATVPTRIAQRSGKCRGLLFNSREHHIPTI